MDRTVLEFVQAHTFQRADFTIRNDGVSVRAHNPLLEIDLGCVMCLRCAMQTAEARHGSRARAAWGWLRADACEGLFEWKRDSGFYTPILALCRSAALKMRNCCSACLRPRHRQGRQSRVGKICRALRRRGRRQARLWNEGLTRPSRQAAA